MDAPVGLIGGISDVEGRWLADLASTVPAGHVIVELGSACGQSSCWLAYGSSRGAGVPVHCYDPWQWKPDDKDIFDRQVGETGADQYITVHHTATRDDVSLSGPVGLWFHDASHDADDMLVDYHAWRDAFADHAWLVWHDWIAREWNGVAWVPMVPERTHQAWWDREIAPDADRWGARGQEEYLYYAERFAKALGA